MTSKISPEYHKRLMHRERVRISQKKRLSNPEDLRHHQRKLRIYQERKLRQLSNRIEQNKRTLENYYRKLSDNDIKRKAALKESFLKDVKDGPFWTCACCSRLWFRYSVKHYTTILTWQVKVKLGFCMYIVGAIYLLGKIPKLSLYYKELVFPIIPPELLSLSQL